MKPTIAYYLLLLYTTVMLKPLLPLISDAASHFFAGAYHEATVHAKYGVHHVDAELANAGADSNAGKHQLVIPTNEPIPLHLFTNEEAVTLSAAIYKLLYPFHRHSNLPVRLMTVNDPPPKHC